MSIICTVKASKHLILIMDLLRKIISFNINFSLFSSQIGRICKVFNSNGDLGESISVSSFI